jgi:hypothetical protein
MDTSNTSFIDKVINGLKKAAVELEEFQLQLALGKAEVSDKYEEVKKNFNEVIHEAKVNLAGGTSIVNDLKGKLEELQLQLALGKAETKDSFKEQKIKILNAIHDIEVTLKMTDIGAELYSKLNSEIEKFKIKMEILSLKFELGKMDAKVMFEEKRKEFADKADKIKQKFSESESVIEKSWDQFTTELKDAYGHLKNAFIK